MSSNVVVMTKKGKELKVVESAFEAVWKKRGWVLKGEKDDAPKPAQKPVPAAPKTESATED